MSLPTQVVPFLRSMRHLCLSCNGLGFAVMPSRILLTLPGHGPPGQDLANPDQWSAPILLALKQAHQVLLTDFGCHEWSINGPAPVSAIPQIEDSSPNPAAERSAVCISQRCPTFDSTSPHPALQHANSRFKFGWQR